MSMWLLYDIVCFLDIVELTVMSILLMRISDQQIHALHVVCLSHIRIQLITSQQTAIFTTYIHISIQNNCTELSTPPSCHPSYSKFVTKIQRNNCLTDKTIHQSHNPHIKCFFLRVYFKKHSKQCIDNLFISAAQSCMVSP